MFQGRGGFVIFERFDKPFVKKLRKKKASEGKILEFFLLDTLKTTFWMEYFTEKWTISGPFVPQIRALFSIFKKGARAVFPLPSHSCAPEYTKCVCSALENVSALLSRVYNELIWLLCFQLNLKPLMIS